MELSLTTAPYSIESEMMVLGCMLSEPHSHKMAAEALEESDFYVEQHKLVFRALKAAYSSKKPVDVHIISEELKKLGKFDEAGGSSTLVSLCQYSGTSAYIEEYVSRLKEISNKRKLALIGRRLCEEAYKENISAHSLLEKLKNDLNASTRYSNHSFQLEKTEERLEVLNRKLEKSRGKKYLGLCQKTLPDIDEKLLGFRKLLLLAAAPNAGKTALTNQIAIDVLKNHKDACVIYFSLEMAAEDLLIRMLCNLSQTDYRTFVRGSNIEENGLFGGAVFTPQEMKNIEDAETQLRELEWRLQIIDKERCPFLNASLAISYIENLKNKTKCSRVLVVIDYMQVWPLDPNMKPVSEIENDKWRMGEVMKIRNAINDDPIIVISEARKPQKDSKWMADLSDVMGTARMTYSPDAVMLLNQLDESELRNLIVNEGKLSSNNKNSELKEESIIRFQEYLEKEGISICKIDLPKGRDGMERFSLLIEFHFRKTVFKQMNFNKIKNRKNKN